MNAMNDASETKPYAMSDEDAANTAQLFGSTLTRVRVLAAKGLRAKRSFSVACTASRLSLSGV